VVLCFYGSTRILRKDNGRRGPGHHYDDSGSHWVRKGVLSPHRCGREVMFPCAEIDDLKRPKPIVLADTSLNAIAKALVADESEPTIETPESPAMLAPRPTRTEGVFRMGPNGQMIPVRPCRPKTDEKQTDRTPVEAKQEKN
jgi:hypothetical protein